MQLNGAAINAGTTINGPSGGAAPFVSVNTAFGSTYPRAAASYSWGALSYQFDYTPNLSAAFTIEHRLNIKDASELSLLLVVNSPFNLLEGTRTAAPFEINYSLLSPVSAPFEIEYSVLEKVNAAFVIDHALVTTVNAPLTIDYNILSVNPVSAAFTINYNIQNFAPVQVTNAIVLTHNGKQVDIQAGSLSQDEDAFNWRGRVILADVDSVGLFRFNDDVELSVYGEVYNMIVQSRSRNRRSPAGASATLELLGVAARLDTPIAEPITQTFGTVDAKAAVETILGVSVTWQLLNWSIPANRLSGESVSPVLLASDIARAAGGRLEANPDGSIVVRHSYPVTTPLWPTAAVDHTYTELDDILAIEEGFQNQQVFNKYRIRSGEEAAFNDQIEFTSDEGTGLAGTVVVFPSPLRTVELDTTGAANIALTKAVPHVVNQTSTETIEFTGGTASVRRPIKSITTVVWTVNNLGGVSFDVGSTTLTATNPGPITDPESGYSIATITYVSESRVWNTSSPIPQKAQFIAYDENA